MDRSGYRKEPGQAWALWGARSANWANGADSFVLSARERLVPHGFQLARAESIASLTTGILAVGELGGSRRAHRGNLGAGRNATTGYAIAFEKEPLLPRAAAWFILCITLAAGCAPRSDTGVRNVHIVAAGTLVRGAQADAAGLAALKEKYGIRTIVNFNDHTADSERETAGGLGLAYVALPTSPFHPESEKVMAFLRVMRDPSRSGAVYVHCKDGMDRTGVAVAAYRIVIDGWETDRAIDEMQQYRTLPHVLAFPDIPPTVRRIGQERQQWLNQLEASPEPTVAGAASAAPH
jgi:hypothetical protein